MDTTDTDKKKKRNLFESLLLTVIFLKNEYLEL